MRPILTHALLLNCNWLLSIMLIRRIPDKNKAAHEGIWLKESKGSHELRGKTLGIIGYGNIGSQVSVLAEALGDESYFL